MKIGGGRIKDIIAESLRIAAESAAMVAAFDGAGRGRGDYNKPSSPSEARLPMSFRQLALAFCLITRMSLGAGGAPGEAGNEVAPTDSPHLLMPHSNDEAGLWLSSSWRSAVAQFKAQGAKLKRTSAESLDSSSHVKACARACAAGGTCNIFTGRCACQLGHKGEACEERDHYPCNNPNGVWTVSTCFGECNLGRCFCGHGMKNPKRPMHHVFFPEAETTWRNAIRNNDSKMLAQWDIDPALEPEFSWLQHGHNTKQSNVLDWCNARSGTQPPRSLFGCRWPEHHGGALCSLIRDSVCVNQCSGRGLCKRGMCKCDPGWSGIDCSLQAPERLLRATPAVGDGGDAGKLSFEGNRLMPRIFVYEVPEVFNVRMLQFRRLERCTTREFTDSDHPRFNNWQYSLDYMLHEWLLHSDHRTVDPEEADYFFVPFHTSCYNYLGDDTPRHRLMFGSRTIATAQAAKLLQKHLQETYPFWDRKGGADHIWVWAWDEGGGPAPLAIRPSILVSHWGGRYTEPRTAYGADDWLRSDIGAWAAVGQFPFGMAFQDLPITYGMQYERFVNRSMSWAGHKEERGEVHGYDPAKDIVMPAPYFRWQETEGSLYRRWLSGRLRDFEAFNSKYLFYFAGELGREAAMSAGKGGGRGPPNYSWGIRQRVAALYADKREWRERGIHIYHGGRPDYLGEVSRSVFCGAMPGDGWSHAYAWAVLHGCIPVLIMDDAELAWSSVMNYSAFSLRIAQADVGRLPEILGAVPQERIREMQEVLFEIWPSFTYVRYRHDLADRLEIMGYNSAGLREQAAGPRQLIGDDAFDMLLQVLYSRLPGISNEGSS